MNRATTDRAHAFETLILPHGASLYAPAMALTRSSAEAEDLVQDTLVRAFDRFETFRSDGSPRAWLHTIMRNLFYNAYRKRSREPRHVSLESLEPGSGPALDNLPALGLGDSPTRDPRSPERQVLAQMEGDALLQAVRQLPDDYRRVVVMADLQGMPYQDIAVQLDIPIGTVRSRLSRGRERVRRSLAAWRLDLRSQPAPTSRVALAA